MIRITGLHNQVLSIDSLEIGPGMTTIIGPNGSGKTTLLKYCSGITVPESGSILVDGRGPRQTDIGWVGEFPDRNFLFDRVPDEISSTLRFRHICESEIGTRTQTIMQKFGQLPLLHRPVQDLSGGEKILVAVAAAVIQDPRLLILDECDSHLDHRSSRQMYEILKGYGISHILRSTQDMEIAAESDHLIFLDDGKVRYSGQPAEVFANLRTTPFYPLSWMCRQ